LTVCMAQFFLSSSIVLDISKIFNVFEIFYYEIISIKPFLLRISQFSSI
jgi:hypothetical protein